MAEQSASRNHDDAEQDRDDEKWLDKWLEGPNKDEVDWFVQRTQQLRRAYLRGMTRGERIDFARRERQRQKRRGGPDIGPILPGYHEYWEELDDLYEDEPPRRRRRRDAELAALGAFRVLANAPMIALDELAQIGLDYERGAYSRRRRVPRW